MRGLVSFALSLAELNKLMDDLKEEQEELVIKSLDHSNLNRIERNLKSEYDSKLRKERTKMEQEMGKELKEFEKSKIFDNC